mgnify:FL=1|jgi:hypothetical protein
MSEQQENNKENHTVGIAVSWGLVGIPLAYGLVETVRRAANLFVG